MVHGYTVTFSNGHIYHLTPFPPSVQFHSISASPSGMLFKPNITAYKNGLYKMIGQMFAMCLVQGGEPPSILAPPVVDYLVSGDITKVNASILDVPNHKVRQDLQKVL